MLYDMHGGADSAEISYNKYYNCIVFTTTNTEA
jgi:hypothetical protein